jgi:hypothetical protein
MLALLFSALNASASEQQAGEEEEEVEKEQSAFLDWVERERHRSESYGHGAARWVDAFFSDPEYEAEIASSQARIRPELFYGRDDGTEVRVKVSFKLRLPNIERKVSLVGGSSDFDSGFDEAVDDDINEPVVGLQFFGKERKKWHTSGSVGLKFNEFAGFIGPRFRYMTDWSESTSFRFVQKILWQTNNEWQFRSRFDFNFTINDRYFFRQMVDARWRGEDADEEGYRTRLSSLLTRRLDNAAGLQSEVTAIFHTRPDTHVDEYIVAMRYRKRAWREWFYYEIVPQISWKEEFNYRTSPGIGLRIEVFYGGNKGTDFWRREAEDTEDFRW